MSMVGFRVCDTLFPLELSRDITEKCSVMGTPSLPNFLKSYWLIFLKMSPSALDQWWTLRTQVMRLMPTKCLHSSHPSKLQDWTSARLLTSPFHGESGEPRADTVAKGSYVAADAAWRTHCLSMQPPASERRSAMCKAQSLGSSLIHTIPYPHQQLLGLEDTALLFTQ